MDDDESHTPSPPFMKWSPQALEPDKEFIMTFGTLPILWDKDHIHYGNKYKRNEALHELLDILKIIKPTATIDDVKKKINTLRSNYRRELKKIENSKRSGTADDDVYTPKSWTFEYLHFLYKVVHPTINSNAGENVCEEIIMEPSSQLQIQSIFTTKDIAVAARRNMQIKRVIDKKNYLLQRTHSVMPESSHNNSIAIEWAETLNTLDPIQKIFAKKAINDVLFEAQLGTLNRRSVKINKLLNRHINEEKIEENNEQFIAKMEKLKDDV